MIDHEQPDHQTVLMGGVEIDVEMATTIQAFWSAGLKTRFCCQGEPSIPDCRYITFSSLEDIALAVSMIEAGEVAIGSHNCIRYRGDLRLKDEPGEPATLPWLPMGDPDCSWIDEEWQIYDIRAELMEANCQIVDGRIESFVFIGFRYNWITNTPDEIAELHKRELDRFNWGSCYAAYLARQ